MIYVCVRERGTNPAEVASEARQRAQEVRAVVVLAAHHMTLVNHHPSPADLSELRTATAGRRVPQYTHRGYPHTHIYTHTERARGKVERLKGLVCLPAHRLLMKRSEVKTERERQTDRGLRRTYDHVMLQSFGLCNDGVIISQIAPILSDRPIRPSQFFIIGTWKNCFNF